MRSETAFYQTSCKKLPQTSRRRSYTICPSSASTVVPQPADPSDLLPSTQGRQLCEAKYRKEVDTEFGISPAYKVGFLFADGNIARSTSVNACHICLNNP